MASICLGLYVSRIQWSDTEERMHISTKPQQKANYVHDSCAISLHSAITGFLSPPPLSWYNGSASTVVNSATRSTDVKYISASETVRINQFTKPDIWKESNELISLQIHHLEN